MSATTSAPTLLPHTTTTNANELLSLFNQSNEPPSLGSQILSGIYYVGTQAAAGALAGYAFSLINPVGGAIFGATSALSHSIATGLAARFAVNQTAIKVAVWAVSFVASVGVGLLVTTAAGFPLTVMAAAGMTAAMLLTSIGVNLVTSGILCCSGCAAACVGGAVLAAKEKYSEIKPILLHAQHSHLP